MADTFTFYSRNEYFDTLTQRVAATKKGDQVTLATMAFQASSPAVQALFKELYAAAERGVKVRVMIDAYAFLLKEGVIPGPLVFTTALPGRLTKTFRMRHDMLETLREKGGQYTITNFPGRRLSAPFAGRSHIKFAVVNDDVFIGGCNLSDDDHMDMMVSWKDAAIAGWLRTFEAKVARLGSVKKALKNTDTTLPVGAGRLMIDAGVAHQSLIFDSALSLIATAEKYVYLTCQYFPNDATIHALAAAAGRGVDVTIVYNHPNKHGFPLGILHHGVLLSQKSKRPDHFFSRQLPRNHDYIHAKLLATDKGTIIGSHNYVRAGVAFGTAEIALATNDPKFGKRAIRKLEASLKQRR